MSKFKKVSVEIAKLKAGDELIGTLTQISDRDWFDKENGEMKQIKQFHITKEDGENVVYFGDGGFRNAMSMAGIQIGDLFKAVKLEKTELKGGRTVNSYEIYKAE